MGRVKRQKHNKKALNTTKKNGTMKISLVFLLLAVSFAVTEGHDGYQSSRVRYTGYVAGDNFFDFYVNGRKLPSPSDDVLLPHTGYKVDFRVNSGRKNVIAVHLRDFADPSTGLEWDQHCIGDGGFRLLLETNLGETIQTGEHWKCKAAFVGPLAPPAGQPPCFSGMDIETRHCKRVAGPACCRFRRNDNSLFQTQNANYLDAQDGHQCPDFFEWVDPTNSSNYCRFLQPYNASNQLEWVDTPPFEQDNDPSNDVPTPRFGRQCNGQVKRFPWFYDDTGKTWRFKYYDDSDWPQAKIFSEAEVGWGVPPFAEKFSTTLAGTGAVYINKNGAGNPRPIFSIQGGPPFDPSTVGIESFFGWNDTLAPWIWSDYGAFDFYDPVQGATRTLLSTRTDNEIVCRLVIDRTGDGDDDKREEESEDPDGVVVFDAEGNEVYHL